MIDFSYKTYGDKNSQPLIMLHGFMGESSDFDSLANRLQENYYCIAIDLPGHGQTIVDSETDYIIEKTSEALIQFLDEKKINNSHLLGYSMGGRVAYYLLTHYPNVFHKAIIESSSPGLKTEQEKIERVQKDLFLSKRMRMEPIAQFLDDWYSLDLFSSIDKNSEAYNKMIERKTKNNIDNLALSLKYNGTGAMPSMWNMLAEITAEVLLITGALDKKYTSIAKEISSEHENISHEIIDATTHNVHFENEEQYYKTVENYLK